MSFVVVDDCVIVACLTVHSFGNVGRIAGCTACLISLFSSMRRGRGAFFLHGNTGRRYVSIKKEQDT